MHSTFLSDVSSEGFDPLFDPVAVFFLLAYPLVTSNSPVNILLPIIMVNLRSQPQTTTNLAVVKIALIDLISVVIASPR
jgi:hypothetical protein